MKNFILIFIVIFILFIFISCVRPIQKEETQEPDNTTEESKEGLSAVFFPVGKGDCTILCCDGETMLIDAGYSESAGDILDYLNERNIKALKSAVATHPDKDHIGGFAQIIRSGIQIEKFYKTKAKKDIDEYSAFISALDDMEINVIKPKVGDSFTLGNASVTFFGPETIDYKDINNTSIVLKIEYKGKSMLFTGDMLKEAEKDLLSYAPDFVFELASDVLKVGHHGSDEASGKNFLQAVKPTYAVITCDEINEGSKSTLSEDVLKRLENIGTTVLRTDTDGLINISINTEGEITVSTKKMSK